MPTARCLFCGGDVIGPDHFKTCDGRQGQLEAEAEAPVVILSPAARGVTGSTDEAMDLHWDRRPARIVQARYIAEQLIHVAPDHTTHSRAVLAAMEARGLLTDDPSPDYWLGAVFRGASFVWTGAWYTYSDDRVIEARGVQRNIHERTVKVWTLRCYAAEDVRCAVG